MSWLTDPFTPLYMQRALLELGLLAVPAGTLGAFVVLRRLAFGTHALGVGTFPGVVVAFGLGFSAFVGGLAAAVTLALALAVLQRRSDLDPAAATGLLLAGALALGSLLVSNVFAAGAQVDTLLFGSLFGITDGDLFRSVAVSAVSLLVVAAAWRGLVAVAFDQESAAALGFRASRYDLVLFCCLAVTIVAAVDAVGTLLVSSLFVVPAAAARLVTRRLVPLAITSCLLAVGCALVGLVVSYHTGAPPGATVAVVAAGIFLVFFAIRTLAEPRARRAAALGAAALAIALLAAGCGSGGGERGGGRLRVVATTTHVADWVREVGGSHVTVTQLLKPLVDPHEFEPGPVEANAVAVAKLVVASGAGVDAWITDLAKSAGGDAKVVELAPTAKLRRASASGEGRYDPHYWHDPTIVEIAIRTLGQALAAADPADAAAYRAAAGRYVAELHRLDRELRREFGSVAPRRRKLVTDHDAFGYLAARYGIRVVGTAIPSMSTAAEPSARDTAHLIDTIRREHVRVLFSEESVDPKLVRQIASATKARVDAGLYGDTLGQPGSDAATYLGMMSHNARHLLAAFRGSP